MNEIIKKVPEFIKDWGALIVSSLSLLVAFISLIQSAKARKQQRKINEIELKLKQYAMDKAAKEREEANAPCVQARIIEMGKRDHRLKVWNSGGKTAYNVDIDFQDNPGIINMDHTKLPFEELDPMKSFELTLLVEYSASRKGKVLTMWEDENHNHMEKSQMYDI